MKYNPPQNVQAAIDHIGQDSSPAELLEALYNNVTAEYDRALEKYVDNIIPGDSAKTEILKQSYLALAKDLEIIREAIVKINQHHYSPADTPDIRVCQYCGNLERISENCRVCEC